MRRVGRGASSSLDRAVRRRRGIEDARGDAFRISALLAALKSSRVLADIDRGREIHAEAVFTGCDSDGRVGSALIAMYSKCRSMAEARNVFDAMEYRDVVSWNAIMLGYAENGEGPTALELFSRMVGEGVCVPNERSFVAALKACSSIAASRDVGARTKMEALSMTSWIHSRAFATGCCESNAFVANALVDAYAKCGSILDARRVFEGMEAPTVVSWNALLCGFAENGLEEVALEFFEKMVHQSKDCKPDSRTFAAVGKACANLAMKESGEKIDGRLVKLKALEKGMSLQALASRSGCDIADDVFLVSALVSMYAKCGAIADAGRVFSRVPRLDVVSWNTLLLGYAENEEEDAALDIFTTVFTECFSPTAMSFVAALIACINLSGKEEARLIDGKPVKVRCLESGMALHARALKAGLENEKYVASMLITVYATCGSLADSWRVFKALPFYDLVSTTTLMQGCVDNGEPGLAFEIYTLVRSCPELRDIERQSKDTGAFLVGFQACGALAALSAGKQVHADACRCGVEQIPTLGACLMDFYGRCGSMIDSQAVFDSSPTRDSASWTSLIAGYSRQGTAKQVFESFEAMLDDGFQPDSAVLCCLIVACGCSGLVDEGRKIFDAAVSKFGAVRDAELYHAMIDMLSRANMFEEAMDLVGSMPFEPTSKTWMILLGACSKWKNVRLARLAFYKLMELDKGDSSTYVLMANIYSC